MNHPPVEINYGASDDVMLYFDYANDTLPTLPLDTTFDIVYSPSPFINNYGWRQVTFRVVMGRNIHSKQMERTYRVERTYFLMPDEIAEVEDYLNKVDWLMCDLLDEGVLSSLECRNIEHVQIGEAA